MKRLLALLKKIFFKDKKEIQKIIEQTNTQHDSTTRTETLKKDNEKNTIETIKENEKSIESNKVINYGTINQEKIKNINWNLINSLKDNDIVLVKMTIEEIENNDIEKSHQNRPFLIREKNDEEELVHSYYCTSNIKNNYFFKRDNNKGLKIVFNKNNYNLNKNTLLMFNKEINLSYENIIHWMDHINKDDLNKLKKYRNLLFGQMAISDKNNKVIEIGDIILNNGIQYVIYQMDNTQCYGYQINEVNKKIDIELEYNYIYFNNKLYYINFQRNKVFDNNDTLCIINRFNIEIIEQIKQNKKTLKHENKNKSKKKKR